MIENLKEEIREAGEWITLKEASRILNCSARTIRRRVDNGKIETRIEYQGKQAIRYVRRGDILREAGTIQHREPKEGITEVVTRGATYDNPMTTLGQVKKVVTGLIWKITAIVAGIIILGGVTTYYLVIGQSNSISGKIEGVKGELSQGLSQVQAAVVTGLNVTRKGLTAEIEEIRIATRTDSQATGEKISRQGEDILRTGDQVTAQAEKIEAQTVEIKELRAAIAELQAGIEVIREEVTRPTPAPAATVPPETVEPVKTPAPVTTSEPPAPAEEAGGFLGIF